LGTAWTTAILTRQDDIAELLGIPEGMTQIAMIPVARSQGADFKRAPRYPAQQITYVDGFARTWEQGPSDPPRHADGPGTIVEVDIRAPAGEVWPYASDISFGAAFSQEFVGARWADGVGEPALGAQFIGSNTHPAIGNWDVPCFVNQYQPGRRFGWVTSDPDNPGARWSFDLASIAGATRLRYSVILGPGPSGITAAIENMPDKESRILARRIDEHRANMQLVVDGIKAAVEADAAASKAGLLGTRPPLS
jgi:hypothetical protein